MTIVFIRCDNRRSIVAVVLHVWLWL